MKVKRVILIALVTLLFSACAAPQAPAPAQAPVASQAPAAQPTKAPAPTQAPAAAGFSVPNVEAYLNASRADTLILDANVRLEGAENWNPFVPGNANGFGGQILGTSPLVLLSYGSGEIEPYMAESFTSNADSTEWTLRMRKGITWSDGHPLTVDDVIFTVQLELKTSKLGANATYNEWIKSIDKIDDQTAKFVLKKPDPRFALTRWSGDTCGYDWIVPKHIWEKVPDPLTYKNLDIKAGLPLSSGPYVLAKITTNEAIWVRNDNWWAAKTGFKKLPAPKRVIFGFYGNEEVRTATAADNGLDGLQDITLSSLQALMAKNKMWKPFINEMPYTWVGPCPRSISVNNAVEPWNDKDMRWMLSDVMDRPQILDVAYEGTTIMTPYFWPQYPPLEKYGSLVPKATVDRFKQPNLAKAVEILTAKGYKKGSRFWEKDGKPLSLVIQVNEAYSEQERVADVYIEQLLKFGIDASKQKLTSGTWGDNFALGNYAAQSGWQTCGSITDPFLTLRTMAGTAPAVGQRPQGLQNSFRYANAKFTDLVQQLGVLPLEDPKMLDITKQAVDILYDELPVIPICSPKKLIPFNETYWIGWPTKDNYYQKPTLWCSNFVAILTEIQPAKK